MKGVVKGLDMQKYILLKHDAKQAGLHYDLRFEMPKSKKWASFALPKAEVPTEPNKRVTIIRTHDHTKEEALFTGTIEKGYGTGTLKEIESGKCEIQKFSDKHMVVKFNGRKLNGTYQFVNTSLFDKSKHKPDTRFMFFKSKQK